MSLDGVTVSRKGPRTVEMQLGEDGYGFHMYTNKQLKGQYVKTISETGNAIKAGLMVGDRVVEVDGENVEGQSHQEVVSLIRRDTGGMKRLLVIDRETEELFRRQGRKVSAGSYVEVMESITGTRSSRSQLRHNCPNRQPRIYLWTRTRNWRRSNL